MSDYLWVRPANLTLPDPDENSVEFWEELKQGRLLLQVCGVCKQTNYPPMVMCSGCGGFDFQWREAEGGGVLYSYVVTHQPIHPSLVDYTPFLTALIELDEGPRITSNIINIPPEQAEIGMRVKLELFQVNPQITLPLFVHESEG